MSGPPSFLEELKRRKVVRAAAVYGAVVFVVIQVADIVFPALVFPEWTFPFVLVLCLLGFPLTLALSWSFDLTSQGVKRTEDEPSQTGSDGVAHSWFSPRSAGVAAVLLLGG